MSDEKHTRYTIHSDGYAAGVPLPLPAPVLASDLESGRPRGRSGRRRRNRKWRVFKKVVLFFACFFIVRNALNAYFGRLDMMRFNEYRQMALWRAGYGEYAAANEYRRPNHDRYFDRPHHRLPPPPHYWGQEEHYPHHPPHRWEHDGFPQRRPYPRPHPRPRPHQYYERPSFDRASNNGYASIPYLRPQNSELPPGRVHRPYGSEMSKGTQVRPKPIKFTGSNDKLAASSPRRLIDRINPLVLNRFSQGKLPAHLISRLFKSADSDVCVPVVPVSGLENVSFSLSEFPKISNKVVNGIGADINIVKTTDSEASFEISAMASTQEIADKISLSVNKDSDGAISFELNGPKWLGRNDCAYAKVLLKIPESTTNLVALNNAYVYGNFRLDRDIARKVTFGDFNVNAAVSQISIPPIHAENVIVNSVVGGVHGFFHVSDSLSIHTVRSNVDVGVNVRKADKSAIKAESVSGQVSLRVAGGFDGSFSTSTITGEIEVEDASDGSNRLHFDKENPHRKSGTFGPADSVKPGQSTLRASSISGNVQVEFE
ncbi:hypothetical protein H4R20_000732 [Coemansia guatemalensis]|uniref:Adhesin domain-containing protein n=1 Tax=Coemansia guatemalensis TaxID=2761395 RepID=A0A9W8LTW4_9FUNG|nr:hypothetical protein H4R20_000732 [Coemansia guatemalensis]